MDIKRIIQFLLRQQAKHDARRRQFEEAITRINDIMNQTNAVLERVANLQKRTRKILAMRG